MSDSNQKPDISKENTGKENVYVGGKSKYFILPDIRVSKIDRSFCFNPFNAQNAILFNARNNPEHLLKIVPNVKHGCIFGH